MSDQKCSSLRDALVEYSLVLEAATVPSPEGRRIPDVFGALVLSKAADKLYLAVFEAYRDLPSQAITGSDPPVGIRLLQSDSPDGPWKPIPDEAVRVSRIPLRKGDPQVAVYGALERAALASGFPAPLWNALQAAKPGGDHNRYKAGDIVSQADLELAAAAERLLKLAPTDTGSESRGTSQIDVAKVVLLRFHDDPHSRPQDVIEELCKPKQSAAESDGGHVFQLCGEIWKLKYDGEETYQKHTPKSGLLYIRELIRNKGKPVFAVDVANIVADKTRRACASSGDSILDDDGRLALRKRYNDLELELYEAKKNNDQGCAISARNEKDEIEAQLLRAFGLGGRDRRMGDDVARAANRVSTAIGRAIDKIEKQSQPLATHLRNCLDLGRFMIYLPENDISWVC